MKTIPTWKRLLGCRDCEIWWRHGHQDLSTVRGMFVHGFWTRVEWLRDLPRSLEWRLANRIAALAQRLRGDQTYDLGYGIEANLAGMLADSIRMKIVMWDVARTPLEVAEEDAWKLACREEEREELQQVLSDLDALAGLAKASTWLEYWNSVRGRDYRREETKAALHFDY